MNGLTMMFVCLASKHDWAATGEWDYDLEHPLLRCAKCGREKWGDVRVFPRIRARAGSDRVALPVWELRLEVAFRGRGV